MLKAHVTGPAKLFIDQYDPMQHSFELAWEAMKNRFGRPDIIKLHYIRVLENLEKPKEGGPQRVSSLWKLVDTVRTTVANLQYLQVDTSNLGLTLCPRIVERLPLDLAIKWATRPDTQGRQRDIGYLLDFIQEQASGLELARAYTSVNESKVRKHTDTLFQGSATALATVTSGARSGNSITSPHCILCKGAHWPRRCPQYNDASIEKRYQLAVEHQLCFRCLREGHWQGKCDQKCSYCDSEAHHGTLCRVKQADRQKQRAAARLASETPVGNQVAAQVASGGAIGGQPASGETSGQATGFQRVSQKPAGWTPGQQVPAGTFGC